MIPLVFHSATGKIANYIGIFTLFGKQSSRRKYSEFYTSAVLWSYPHFERFEIKPKGKIDVMVSIDAE